MTVEDFESQLENLGQALSTIDNILLNAGGKMVADMKQHAPFDTGALYSSLAAVVENNTLKISMLNYGAFQNYGVAGQQGESRFGVVDAVQDGVDLRPTTEPKYKYKTKKFGIPARRFFNTDDIADYVAIAIEEHIANQLR
jgi:hypothetical protein